MKTCNNCQESKNETEFSPDKNSADGRRADCRTCKNTKGKEKIECETCKKYIARRDMWRHKKTHLKPQKEKKSKLNCRGKNKVICAHCKKTMSESTAYRHELYGCYYSHVTIIDSEKGIQYGGLLQ